ncbi:HNH endonuclease [Mycobacterium avium subsp. paratuberculosis]|uniref:HNH endonuclease signature motif containing protein n=1 Tax=Mycobacterium avium TaxID=1764 RepID=UPI000F4DBD71|nr:HNH endonuclease signature motif containing protein [Mycobacterium avium]AZA71754.1 HNH endonuclease [Mycobacterium avium subsp. paratuberculosis]AZB13733.1 HNH endonuclease [Mycobacterium avium subsp. paratuberculosis]AZB37765.1 HNH endonuclease [Mycobacterium avium subsp. paratuberculosis]
MSSDRGAVSAAFDVIDAALDDLLDCDYVALATREKLALLTRCERLRRRLPAVEHPLINALARDASPAELGGRLSHAIAEATLISRAEAARRVHTAADLGPRVGLTGEPLPPLLAATAAAQRAGLLGLEQVAVIRKFCHQLPGWIDQATRERAETDLANQGGQYRPEQLAALAGTLADCLNPDGLYRDEDRARRRSLTLGNQQADGMSELRGWLSPELRATLEAVLAKLAAPGMCNSLDESPCVEGTPSQHAIDGDARSAAQRNHDGLLAGLRALLASGNLGQHNGLPASIIVTTTLADLETAAGRRLTGGGTLLPMSDVIRLSRHAHHYLAIFDQGKALALLYHTKRLASPAQRIVLYAKDRGCTAPGCTAPGCTAPGCTAPGCTVPGYYSEVHHCTDYATCHTTDINDLTFACGPHHRLLQPGAWTTHKNAKGETEWIPPPHLDRNQPRTNTFHHPEKLLRGENDNGEDEDEDEDSDDAG